MNAPMPGRQIWRDFETDGIPSSGPHKPRKSDIRTWSSWVEGILSAFTNTGGLVYSTLASLSSDLNHSPNSMAWVIGDETASNNGVYMKVGASGSGSWTRVADLPYSFVTAEDEGAGTPNAIEATSSLPVSGSALVLLNVFETNTASPVTVSFNGNSALTIKSNSGGDILPGGLQSGMLVMGRISGSTFRLVSDQVSTAIIAEAEAVLSQVEIIRDVVLGAVPNVFSPTRATLKTLDVGTTQEAYLTERGREGQFIWRTGNYAPHVSSDPQEGIYVKADGIAASAGAWVRVYSGGLKPEYFGAKVDGLTDDSTAFQACINLALFINGVVQLPAGTMRLKATTAINVSNSNNLALKGAGQNVSVLSYSDAATHGIAYVSSQTVDNYHPCFEVSDFSIETSRKNAGTAISATWANANNIERPFFMNRVEMRQCITRASDDGSNFGYWTRGVYCSNARNSTVEHSYFMGEMNLTPTSQAAFELDNESTFFTFNNVLVLEADTGIYAHGTTEGVKVLQCSIVGVRYGIHHVTTTGAEPELMVIGTDINAEEVGVWAQNIQMVTIADCVFFANSWLHSSAWPEWRGVLLQGALNRFSSIKGCHFSKENQRTGDTTTGIDFNEGNYCIIDGNNFYGFNGNPMTFGVQIRSGTGFCTVSETNLFEYVSNKVANNGNNSYRQKIIQSGQATVASGAAVNFPKGFAETPIVTAVHSGTNTAVNVTVSGESTSGFTANHNGGGAVLLSWIAVGN
ncbi:glycosyl hydrolase family 28-related protein [Agrobacterium tumefaciens]|uniref:glycosyl hydrolase family 28-related protein n=1 Tax=Agrobacterium tumefaciens TaxID=358 RepID=UPI001572C59E|nr:glycosyl hydrolase family 28-related protein [Agrobacterium tumefaciens]WHO22636.1 glycosyl hydrolase family 28-related protein [Agrobacterium tumefaciens]